MAAPKLSASLESALVDACHDHVMNLAPGMKGAVSLGSLLVKVKSIAPYVLSGMQIADSMIAPGAYKEIADAILQAALAIQGAVAANPVATVAPAVAAE